MAQVRKARAVKVVLELLSATHLEIRSSSGGSRFSGVSPVYS